MACERRGKRKVPSCAGPQPMSGRGQPASMPCSEVSSDPLPNSGGKQDQRKVPSSTWRPPLIGRRPLQLMRQRCSVLWLSCGRPLFASHSAAPCIPVRDAKTLTQSWCSCLVGSRARPPRTPQFNVVDGAAPNVPISGAPKISQFPVLQKSENKISTLKWGAGGVTCYRFPNRAQPGTCRKKHRN